MAFTTADVLWVAASALVLLLFWPQLDGVARFLIIAVAARVVEGLRHASVPRGRQGLPRFAAGRLSESVCLLPEWGTASHTAVPS